MDKFFGQRHQQGDRYERVNSFEIASNQAALETGCTQFFKRYIDTLLVEGGLSSRQTEKKDATIPALIEEVLKENRLLNKSNIESHIYCQEYLHIDSHQIKFVLNQIIENAILYSEGKTPTTIKVDKSQSAIVLSIKDKGIGIDPFEKNKIFQPFFRGLDAARFSKGIGLGLTLTKEILKNNDAEIRVESQGRGLGTSVFVSFPILDKHIVYRDAAQCQASIPRAMSC